MVAIGYTAILRIDDESMYPLSIFVFFITASFLIFFVWQTPPLRLDVEIPSLHAFIELMDPIGYPCHTDMARNFEFFVISPVCMHLLVFSYEPYHIHSDMRHG